MNCPYTCSYWDRGRPGRVAGWKPALLEHHPVEDPRNNGHHMSHEGIVRTRADFPLVAQISG